MVFRFLFNRAENGEKFFRFKNKVWRTMIQLWTVKNARRKLLALPFGVFIVFVIASWTAQSNSCALHGFLALIIFDLLAIVGDLLCQAFTHGGKPSTAFSFGFVRIEVLTHFSILCLGILLNLWAVKVSLELVFGGTHTAIHTGRFLPSVALGGLLQFFISFNNNPFLKVSKVAGTTTTLQKFFQGICATFGISLSSSSAFSLSPFAILGAFALTTIVVLAFAIQSGPRWLDVTGALLITFAMFDSLWPLAVYTGSVLLQTVPSHTVTQLEKALREALTIDGVLEFRNELFWTLTYGQVAGTLHVRVRRDANEQIVLSRVYEKLVPLSPHLTVQITKDDFSRGFGAYQIIRDSVVNPLTKVTVNQQDNQQVELSPIPNSSGMNHLFLSSSGSTTNVSATTSMLGPAGVGRGGSFSVIPMPNLSSLSTADLSLNRSHLSSTSSSVFNVNVDPASHINTHHLHPNSNMQQHMNHQHHHNNPSNNRNPFLGSNANPPSNNPLISSANYFPDQ